MAHCLTVLVALVAQGMALMSPVCFVRCMSPSGHECVELLGQDCRCEGCPLQEPQPQLCAVAKCCGRCQDQDEEQESPQGPQIAGQDCLCHRTPMESAPQVQNKPLSSDAVSPWHDVLLAPTFVAVMTDNRLEFASLALLRPQESSHLTVLATVVLRV